MKGSYLAHTPRMGSVGSGSVFIYPLVGVSGAGSISPLPSFFVHSDKNSRRNRPAGSLGMFHVSPMSRWGLFAHSFSSDQHVLA